MVGSPFPVQEKNVAIRLKLCLSVPHLVFYSKTFLKDSKSESYVSE